MKSRWSDADAREFRDQYAPHWGEALALRVYTSRLVGAEMDLVMHGGGNTCDPEPFSPDADQDDPFARWNLQRDAAPK